MILGLSVSGLKIKCNREMETLRWAALILNFLWGLQELLLFAAPGLWPGPLGLMHLAVMLLVLLPFFSIFAILRPRHRTLTKIALVLNIGPLILLLINFIRLRTADYHPVALAITELVITFLAMIPLTLSSIYFFQMTVITRNRESSPRGRGQ